ncbi:MAG: membrane protein insertion efficiency factor YidD [Candidatus Magasanikbacteria bacterium]
MRRNLLLYIKKITIFLGWPIVFLIWVYQKTVSPDHGVVKKFFPFGYCRFYPSCSEYGKQSIKKHGVVIGVLKAVWRVVRCNPWSEGGVDLP